MLLLREQALELLKRGWQPGGEAAYDPDDVLVVCRTHAFQEGLMFLYEKLRLFREVLQVIHSPALLDLQSWISPPYHVVELVALSQGLGQAKITCCHQIM